RHACAVAQADDGRQDQHDRRRRAKPFHGVTSTRTGEAEKLATPSGIVPNCTTSADTAEAPAARARKVTLATTPEPDTPVARLKCTRIWPGSSSFSMATAAPSSVSSGPGEASTASMTPTS